jgi:hypothetical protein
MGRRKRPPPLDLALMIAELMVSSWETIVRRSWMIAQGRCSPAEYARMVSEKAPAAHRSGLACLGMRGGRAAAVFAPWRHGAAANAKRLRKR